MSLTTNPIRHRRDVFQEEAPSKKRKTEVQCFSRADIEERELFRSDLSFLNRMKAIEEDFFGTEVTKERGFYFEYKTDEWLLVQLKVKKRFDSKSLHKKFFKKDERTSNEYRYIEVFENTVENGEPLDYLIFKITLSPDGEAELGWLNKGKNLTGTQVFERFEFVQKIFQPSATYLWNDSKIHSEKGETIPFRHMEALRRDGLSFYEKLGKFRLYPCHGLQTIEEKVTLSQNEQEYVKAKDLARKTSLDGLKKYLDGFKKEKAKIDQLRKKYIIDSSNSTIGGLIEAMQDDLKKKDSKAFSDLAWFLGNCLFLPRKLQRSTAESNALQAALKTIDTSRLFYRDSVN